MPVIVCLALCNRKPGKSANSHGYFALAIGISGCLILALYTMHIKLRLIIIGYATFSILLLNHRKHARLS